MGWTIASARGGSLVVEEEPNGGLAVVVTFGGTTTTIILDAFQARDFLLELYAGAFPRHLPVGPAER